ncbi:MAG: hypothetical protein N3A69_13250, partial [Leptospiraceae bacterium]|nr:hypothetical protein [Leptospiraceae bacterium]
IVRVKKTPNSPNFIWGLSKPCKGCLRAIIDMKVDNVIYSLDQDFSNKKDFWTEKEISFDWNSDTKIFTIKLKPFQSIVIGAI